MISPAFTQKLTQNVLNDREYVLNGNLGDGFCRTGGEGAGQGECGCQGVFGTP